MNFPYSPRIHPGKISPVTETLRMSNDPSLISFATGNPSSDAIPLRAVADITANLLSENPLPLLQYSVSQGYPPLREALQTLLTDRYQLPMEENEVIITSGAQQGATLACQLLCDGGDTVLCEDPTFMGCLCAFRGLGARTVGIPMEQDGIDLAHLEQALKTQERVKLLYLIPNFQNPTGITMSLSKRKAVYELAVRYNVPILEDNPYGDLRFAGEPIPSIKSFDTTGHVIYLGSFSKILAPGLRVGYLVAQKDFVAQIAQAKLCDDVHSNLLAQAICTRFITQYNLSAHIASLREIYRRKATRMLTAIDTHFGPDVTVTRPEGGLFLWATLPMGQDSLAFSKKALQRGVAIVPGTAFAAEEDAPSRGFRLNYSTPSDEEIDRGIESLGRLTRELS